MSILIDLLFLGLLLWNLWAGWRWGVLCRLVVLLGLVGGMAEATAAAQAVVRAVHGRSGSDLTWDAGIYLTLVGTCVIAAEVLAALYGDGIRRLVAVLWDQSIGVVIGLVVATAQVVLVCVIASAMADAPAAPGSSPPDNQAALLSATQTAIIGRGAIHLEAVERSVFAPFLPGDLPLFLANNGR